MIYFPLTVIQTGKYMKAKKDCRKGQRRVVHCKKCHTTWNRDVSASINITKIGLLNLGYEKLTDNPKAFVETFPGATD